MNSSKLMNYFFQIYRRGQDLLTIGGCIQAIARLKILVHSTVTNNSPSTFSHHNIKTLKHQQWRTIIVRTRWLVLTVSKSQTEMEVFRRWLEMVMIIWLIVVALFRSIQHTINRIMVSRRPQTMGTIIPLQGIKQLKITITETKISSVRYLPCWKS